MSCAGADLGASISIGNAAFGGLGPEATDDALSDQRADEMLDVAGKC